MLQAPSDTAVRVVADSVASSSLVWPRDPMEFWTLAMFVVALGSGFVALWLAIMARRGLASINHTQKSLDLTQKALALTQADMLNRAKRDSIQCAVDRCNEMAMEIVPMLVKMFGDMKTAGSVGFVKDPSEVSFESDEEVKKINAAIGWMGKLTPDLLKQTVPLMNRVESWSMCFTKGLADRDVAYQPCSMILLQLVTALYPCYLTQRRLNPASGPYQNTVDLFLEWHGQFTKKKLDEQFELLKRAQEGGTKLPPPIGTDLA